MFLRLDSWFPKILITSIALYFYKAAFWPLTYFFIVSYLVVVFIFILRNRKKAGLVEFISSFHLPIILVSVLIFEAIFHGNFTNPVVLKDTFLIIVLFSLFYFLFYSEIFKQNQISIIFVYKILIILTSIISIINLFYIVFPNFLSENILSLLHIPHGTTIANDYNFFCLFLLYGLIILNSGEHRIFHTSKYARFISYLLSLIFIIGILFSGSRRGISVFILLSIFYLFSKIYNKRHNIKIKHLVSLFIFSAIFSLLLIATVTKLVKHTSKKNITYNLLKYSSLLGVNDSNYINRVLWDPSNRVSDSTVKFYNRKSLVLLPSYWKISDKREYSVKKEFSSSYGSGLVIETKNRKVNPNKCHLSYDGPGILYLANHTYEISFIARSLNNKKLSFRIGWQIDDGGREFSRNILPENEISLGNDWYKYTFSYSFIDNQVATVLFIKEIENCSDYEIYNIVLTDINFNPLHTKIPKNISTKREFRDWLDSTNLIYNCSENLINNGSFENGLGFWKFSADCLLIKIEDHNGKHYAHITRGNGNGGYWSLYYGGRIIDFIENNEYELSFKLKPISPNAIPFNVGFEINEGEGWLYKLPVSIDTLADGWLSVSSRYTFKQNHRNLIFPINSQISNSEFFISDLKLINLSQIQFDCGIKNDISNKNYWLFDRSERWKFALNIWNNDYNISNKLFGKGFEYLSLFGNKFLIDASQYDYPHNPFISILLYSGIFGIVLYLLLLYRVLQIYISLIKVNKLLLICFTITFFFSFFSANSPFDPPIMGFFILLPFLINKRLKTNAGVIPTNFNNRQQ